MKAFPSEDIVETLRNFETSDELPTLSSLGMKWNISQDYFTFTSERMDKPNTRREMLSVVHSIWDPMGFLSPYVLTGRQLLREIDTTSKEHNLVLEWDDPLPATLLTKWTDWKDDFKYLPDTKADGPRTELQVATMHGWDKMKCRKINSLSIRGYYEYESYPINAIYSHSTIPASRSAVPCRADVMSIPEFADIRDKFMTTRYDVNIGLLIGLHDMKVIKPVEIRPSDRDYYGIRTVLRWSYVGSHPGESQNRFAFRTLVKEIILIGPDDHFQHNLSVFPRLLPCG